MGMSRGSMKRRRSRGTRFARKFVKIIFNAMLPVANPLPEHTANKMRVLDTTNMEVVSFGKEWPYPDIDPSSKTCVTELERNEGLVTWLQPVGGGIQVNCPD